MENIRMRRMGIWSEIISDIAAVSAGFFLSMKIFNYSARQTAPFYVLFLCITAFFLALLDAYDDLSSYLTQKKRLPVTLAVAFAMSMVSALLVILIVPSLKLYSPLFYTAVFVFCYALLFIGRMIILKVLIKFRKSQSLLILYYPNCPEKFLNKLKIKSADYGSVKLCALTEDKLEDSAVKAVDESNQILILENIPVDIRDKYILYALGKGKGIQVIPTVENLSFLGGRIRHIGDTPVISLKNARLLPEEKFIKRAFDFIASLIGIIITSPIFVIFGILIKLDSKGPVFYKQERYTINKQKFDIYKFRTMVDNAESMGARLATENDDRITRTGKVLRACRLDELPQLFNILKGEMSFVGPRPERPVYADEYSVLVKNYDVRYIVKAGLTGYAQIYGQYNTKVSDKVLFDSIYINNFSLWLDLKLIVQTAMIMFIKESTEGVDEELSFVPQKKEVQKETSGR